MQFQPFLNQLIEDGQHKYLLANPLTLAAMGASDSQVRKQRPKLEEGLHYVYASGPNNTRRLFYTFKGLLELSVLLNSERSKAFRHALMSVAVGGAIIHRPAGQIAPVVCQNEQTNNIQASQSQQLQPLQQTAALSADLPAELLHKLVDLRRDEVELRRSQEETQRLQMLREAMQTHQPAPMDYGQPNDPALVIIQSNENNRGRLRDDPLAVVAVLTAFIFLCSLIMVSFSVVIGSSSNRETQINVR